MERLGIVVGLLGADVAGALYSRAIARRIGAGMKATIDGLSEAIAAMENLAGDKPAAALAGCAQSIRPTRRGLRCVQRLAVF